MIVGVKVGNDVGGDVMAVVGDTVGIWALDLARRRRKAVAVAIFEIEVMVMF